MYQTTLKTTVRATGIGVHTGESVSVALSPAPVNTGVVFRRVDVRQSVLIPAHLSAVSDTTLSTCLGAGESRVSTVEHLLSAFCGMGVDNVYVDLDGPEVPIMDGSAAPFVFLIQSAGLVKQTALRQWIRIKAPIEVGDADQWARIVPHEGCTLSFEIDYVHPVIAASGQQLTFDLLGASYAHTLSRARTFGLLSDYDYIREHNLARGASLENVVVLDDTAVMNPGGLRFENEFVRHKMLDALGDLYLMGHRFLGAYSAYKGGHRLNNALLQAVLSNKDAFEIIEMAA